MPGQSIHFAVAHEYMPGGDGLFYFGNIAPDYIDVRAVKDIIHLRVAPDRPGALTALRGTLEPGNLFELGWLLHLFADMCWDNTAYADFAARHGGEDGWFENYRGELGKLSRTLFGTLPWIPGVRAKIESEELDDTRALTKVLPVPLELGWYRDHVFRRHLRPRENDAPVELTVEYAERFAAETAEKFRVWYGS
ncbi:MAG: hypothetical protein LBS90_03165 [Oscillospiraceae bacterium]|jgi:hypothetical protein|nr:hypothetical protein [Oscillospiraceae bacterium]